MARFQCRPCGYNDHATWAGELVCPRCGGTEGVRAAVGTEEMTDREVEWLEKAIAEGKADQDES